MKKKKIIIISIIATVLLIAIAITVTVLIVNNNNKEKEEQETIKERITTLLENDYEYYYYMYGDVKTTDGSIIIDGDEYYFVEDSLTIDEFEKLVSDTFVSDMQLLLLNPEEEKNEYVNIDDKIYVKKMENPCKKIRDYDFSNMYFEGGSEKQYIYYNQTRSPIYNEDGIWKLGNNIYACESEE